MKMTPMEIKEDTVEGVKSTMVATRYQIPAWVSTVYLSKKSARPRDAARSSTTGEIIMRIKLDPWIDSLTISHPMPIRGCLPPATVGRATIDNARSWRSWQRKTGTTLSPAARAFIFKSVALIEDELDSAFPS